MANKLLKNINGHLYQYSLAQLRKEYPYKSFPNDLSGVDLTEYGCVLSDSDSVVFKDAQRSVPVRVAMHQFLYALRDFGVRVQFEAYTLSLEGHARDYWFTAPYVHRGHVCVQHMAAFFQLTSPDLDTIFSVAGSIEE